MKNSTRPPHDLVEQLQRIRYDLTAAQAKLTDAIETATRTSPPPPHQACPHCGVHVAGTHALAEHLYHTHSGPEPAHWQTAEARAAPDTEPAPTRARATPAPTGEQA